MAARYDLTRLVRHPSVQLQSTSDSSDQPATATDSGGAIPLSMRVARNSDIDHLTENGVKETQNIRKQSGDVVAQIVDFSRNERNRRESTSAEGAVEDERKAVPTRIEGTPVEIEYGGRLSTQEIENPIMHRDFSVQSSMTY